MPYATKLQALNAIAIGYGGMGGHAATFDALSEVSALLSRSMADLFEDGQAGVYFDPSDLATLYQDTAGATAVAAHGDPVGLVVPKAGASHVIRQATAGKRPLYKTSAGKHFLDFDGVDDFLATLNATVVVAQPFHLVMGLRFKGLENKYFFDGFISGGGRLALYRSNTGTILNVMAGTSASVSGVLMNTAACVLTIKADGASSQARRNGIAGTLSGTIGTQSLGGLALGTHTGGTATDAIEVYGLLIRQSLSADELDLAETLMAAKVGVTLP